MNALMADTPAVVERNVWIWMRGTDANAGKDIRTGRVIQNSLAVFVLLKVSNVFLKYPEYTYVLFFRNNNQAYNDPNGKRSGNHE
jgi:hypothetical protein